MTPKLMSPKAHRPKVFLARHGQSESNVEERISGQMNPALTLKGQRQAQRLEEALRGIPLTMVVTSSLKRSMETARPTADSHGIPLFPLDAFKEMSFGVLEGHLRSSLDQEQQQLLDQWTKDKVHFRVPGGECLIDVQQRVLPALSKILADNVRGAVLIVGHRHLNLAILGALMGWNLESIMDWACRSKYMYEIHWAPTPQIHTICLTGDKRGSRVEGCLNEDDELCVHETTRA